MMIPPWMIEEMEEEQRRRERERDSLRLPLEEEARRNEEESDGPADDPRGVAILDISPEHPNVVPI